MSGLLVRSNNFFRETVILTLEYGSRMTTGKNNRYLDECKSFELFIQKVMALVKVDF